MAKAKAEKLMVTFGGSFKADGKTWAVAEHGPGVFFLVTVSMKDGSLFPIEELTRAEALREFVPAKSWADIK